MSLTFKGGIHPEEFKKFSNDKKILNLSSPEKLFIPLLQHTGVSAKPVVKKGDAVKCGSVIGEPSAYISSYIHSSVSGTVIDIIKLQDAAGRNIETVVIENDKKYEIDGTVLSKNSDWQNLDSSQIIDIVKKAGIVGLGGATFPTFVKLNPPKEKKIDTIILNGAECEPFLTADHRLMIESAEKIICGLEIIMKTLNVVNGIIGIENNKKDAIEQLNKIADKTKNIKVQSLKVKYPQGAEKQLIQALTSRKVPPNGLPMDVGIVVNNVGTAKAIFDAVVEGRPLTERVLTVSGDAITEAQNLNVKIGVPIFYIADFAGIDFEKLNKVVIGGPMMGAAISTLDFPVTKGTNGILLLSKKFSIKTDYEPCIRCGKCVSACPMNLLPNMLGQLSSFNKFDLLDDYYISDCMECGSCAYICPANRPLLQWIKLGKFNRRK